MKAKKQIINQLGDQVYGLILRQLWGQLGGLLYDGIIYDDLRNQLLLQLGGQLRYHLYSELQNPNGVEDEG